MPRVYVSIGSNVDRARQVREAAIALRRRFGEVSLSSVYDSPAVGFAGADFYNLVAAFDTRLSPLEVAAALREIEDAQGRRREGPRFADRTLDLDLLLYGDLVGRVGDLQLPRPEILEHAFVLLPLAEIAGAEHHPVSGRTYAELGRELATARAGLRPVAVDLTAEEP
jgi:2-amino-4-hydroxy-6-hydroxymethyldihydropteridine diphosphokinase